MSYDISTLVILGNGIDLHAKLESKYSDFFRKRYLEPSLSLLIEYLKSDNPKRVFEAISILKKDLNFWDIIFILKYIDTKSVDFNWFEIENIIKLELTDKSSLTKKAYQKYNEMKLLDRKFTNVVFYPYITSVSESLDFELHYPLVYFMELNNTASNAHDAFYKFLLSELNRFEECFKEYIKSITNDRYKNNLASIMESFYLNNQKFNVLSFNYTDYKFVKYINSINNIHGLCDENIIFGFDANGINQDEYSYSFTKTCRLMEQYLKISLKAINTSVMDKKIVNLIFYGHSLNDADFSYFHSLFDFYNIAESTVRMVFLYNIHNISEAGTIKSSCMNSVIKLFNRYSKTLSNDAKSSNLLHRLIFDKRVMILCIDDFRDLNSKPPINLF